jgi:hypothetical protein
MVFGGGVRTYCAMVWENLSDQRRLDAGRDKDRRYKVGDRRVIGVSRASRRVARRRRR